MELLSWSAVGALFGKLDICSHPPGKSHTIGPEQGCLMVKIRSICQYVRLRSQSLATSVIGQVTRPHARQKMSLGLVLSKTVV